MSINRELFRKVAEQVEDRPDLHDQAEWGASPACGTVRCVGGWAIHLTYPGEGVYQATYGRGYTKPSLLARELLGLDEYQADSLFYGVCDWQARVIVREFADTGESPLLTALSRLRDEE